MFKKAFTMAELIIALVIVSILAAVTIGIAKTKMAKVDKYSYYIAYSTMQDIAANIISQSEYDVDENGLASVSIYDNKYIANNSPSYKYTFGLGIQDSYNGDMSNNIGGGATMCRKAGLSCQAGKACCSNLCDPVRHICVDQLSGDNGDSPTCSNDYKGVCEAYGLTWKSATCQCVTQCANSNHELYVDNYGVTKCRPKCPEGKTRNSAGNCVCSNSAPSNATMNSSTCQWSCNSGYMKYGNSCVACSSPKSLNSSGQCVCTSSKPAHSVYTSSCGWTCAPGYEKVGASCYESCPNGKVRVGTACVCSGSKPAHSSYTSNCGWTCDSGYEKIDNACYENCPSNKQRSGTTCVCKNSAPANAYLNSDCSWSCNSGYEKIGDACYQNCPSNKKRSGTTCVCKNSAPSNGTLDSDCNPVCNKGYELKGSTCKIIVNCGANEQKTAEGTCECKAGYERAGDGTCLQICSATQYRDETTKACKDCTDSPTWAEYQSVASCSEHVDDTVCQRYGMRYSETKGTCVMKKTAENLCERIKAEYNISGSACNITADQMTSAVQNGFKGQNPHIKMANGTSLYIASDLVKLNELSDAQDVNDRVAYLVYVDVNGDAKGKGTLYQDVFPFYLTMSGKVIPAYDPTVESGGSSAEHLSLNVLYDEYTADGKRVVKAADTNKDFHTAACETGYIRSAKYCGTITPITQCSDPQKDCRFIVNKPMKFFR